jgi:hypothetical protein
MGDDEKGGSGSFGPYKREFETMSQDMKDLKFALVEFRVEMSGFRGNVLGAAKGWAAGIAVAGFVVSVVAMLLING